MPNTPAAQRRRDRLRKQHKRRRRLSASVEPAERARVGITDGLVRVSVGLGEVEDLIADLQTALAAL